MSHDKFYIFTRLNGVRRYQSLHYTAKLTIAGEEWPFEVQVRLSLVSMFNSRPFCDLIFIIYDNMKYQIRSEDMHRVAEFGVAAHWDYKLQTKMIESLPGASRPCGISPVLPPLSESESESESESVEQVVVNIPYRAKQKGRIASYIEALTTSRETIVQNNLFVFISSTERAIDGNIVSIDPSATQIADVLKKYGANIDDEMLDDISAGALTIYRNGVNTSLDEKLYNGDVLTLPSYLLGNLSGRSWEEEVHR
jgi:hypothetical protein